MTFTGLLQGAAATVHVEGAPTFVPPLLRLLPTPVALLLHSAPSLLPSLSLAVPTCYAALIDQPYGHTYTTSHA